MVKYVLAVLATAPWLSAQEGPRPVPDRLIEDFENREILDVVYDGWEPVRSPDHPSCNEVRLEEDPAGARSGRHYVRLHTLGGRTAFRMTPGRAWEVDPGRSCRFSAWVRLADARSNAAAVTLTWMDGKGNLLAEDRSTPVARAREWTETAIEVPRVPAAARRVAVTLRFEGSDVRGSCDFDRLELASRPRLDVTPVGRRLPVFEPVEAPALEVRAPGLPRGDHRIEAVTRTPDGAAAVRLDAVVLSADRPALLQFPPHAPGYYEVHLTLWSGDASAAQRVCPLAVPNPSAGRGGLFGATFNPFTTDYVGAAELMRLGGFRHARVALWDRPSSGRRGAPGTDRILALLRDIGDAEPVSLTGLLAAPPEAVAETDREAMEHGPLALLGARPETWAPALRGAVRDFREHVTHWQLGGEEYASAASRPGAEAALRTARGEILGLSRFARLGVPAAAGTEPPRGADFVTWPLPAVPAPVVGTFETYGAMARPPGARASQAAELLRRLVLHAAEGPRAAAVFLPVDASPLGGLLDADGYPLAPILAIRAANEALTGAVPRKDLAIFAGPVRSHAFERDGRILVAAWSEEGDVEKDVELGPDAEVFPPLGEARRLRPGERLRLGAVPVFLRNVDPELVKTQASLGVSDARLPLQLDPAARTIGFRNAFAGGKLSDVRLRIRSLPAGWTVRPSSLEATVLEPGGELSGEFLFTLPRDTAEGPHEIGLDLAFTRDGRTVSVRAVRTLVAAPAIEIGAQGSPVRGAWGAKVRVDNRSGRPALLAARVRLPGLPERMESLGWLAPESGRTLEYVVPGAGQGEVTGLAEVIVEESGGTRLHARKLIPLR